MRRRAAVYEGAIGFSFPMFSRDRRRGMVRDAARCFRIVVKSTTALGTLFGYRGSFTSSAERGGNSLTQPRGQERGIASGGPALRC